MSEPSLPTVVGAPDPVTIRLALLLRATAGTAVCTVATSFAGAAIDGRAVHPGGLFFAIRGERFDGHDFAAQAVTHGAAGLVLERGRAAALPDEVRAKATIVEVDDVVRALGDLARAHRLGLPDLRVVGVTGSNGKTTTKELLAAILAAAAGDAAVHKTVGNLNNHLGLPLTLLGLRETHRYAVIEMGMSALGEIAYLASLARPDGGIITNVGPVHLESLGSVENVARAKGELLAALPAGGFAVYPDGDPLLAAQAAASPATRRLRFGTAPGAAVVVTSASVGAGGTTIELELGAALGLASSEGTRVAATLAALGLHNAKNAAAAAAAAVALGIGPSVIARGLSLAGTVKHRATIVDIGGRQVLDDCYNASPPSTAAALETLVALARGRGVRAIAVLGDMLELGPDEAMLHRSIGERAAALDVDLLVTVGARAAHIAEGARSAGLPDSRVFHVGSVEEAASAARALPGDYVLVKASRGARLERVLDALSTLFADGSSAPPSAPRGLPQGAG